MKKKLQLTAVGLVFLSFVAGVSLPAPSVSAAEYSCGAYGMGAYSESADCTDPNAPGAPNTGFAKLMEPVNLTVIAGSLALLIAGIVIILKSRHKKHASFTDQK